MCRRKEKQCRSNPIPAQRMRTGSDLAVNVDECALSRRVHMKLRAQTGAAYSTTPANGSQNYNASRRAKIPCPNPYLSLLPCPDAWPFAPPYATLGATARGPFGPADDGYDRSSASRQIGQSGSRTNQPLDAAIPACRHASWPKPAPASDCPHVASFSPVPENDECAAEATHSSDS